MSVVKEAYGYGATHRNFTYRYAVTGINEEQTELLRDLEDILNKAFASAEEQIERALYKKGLMTCNAYLESIDDMRIHGNDLVQAYIKELDEKYKEN